MHYLVIDIETSPVAWDYFDDTQQEYLLRGATTDEEQEKKKNEMALSPFTGHVVCISLIHFVQTDDGFNEEKRVTLMRNTDDSEELVKETLPSGAVMVRRSERAMLDDFWKYLAKVHDANRRVHYVTFNGRGFDFPFLMLRSAALGIRPRVNLMSGSRWNYRAEHTDLLDELCYQYPQQTGATRRFNFDFYTKAFGIRSPKADGVDGSKVAQLYAEGEYATIAEYCLRDVDATWQLYQRWADLLWF
ncbi:MAG: ribonuclease H-like domain-containing protein [Candidatus Kapabacteria bacterium]|nr:ribonuclease H-like domain-containing protein [Candidatus Kapabacteria bacterium]